MIQHRLTVNKDIIEPIPLRIPSGNVETHELVFDFSNEWDGLKKIAVFTRDGVAKEYTIDGATRTVPGDVLTDPGTLSVGVYGYIMDGEKLVKRISTNVINAAVIKGAYASAVPGEDVPPSAYEQLSSKVDGHIANQDNPHEVTAGQVGAYTKMETDGKIAEAVTPVASDITALEGTVSGKLDKVTESAPIDRVYGVGMAGEQITLGAESEFNIPGYIPVYNEDGVIATGTPKKDTDSVNKKYVDEKVAGKLDKVSSYVRVYPGVYATIETDGTPHLITATSDLGYIGNGSGYIPLYAAGGQLKTATPTEDDSAANKGYVDGKIITKLDKIITQSVDLSDFEIINSNSENPVTNNTVTMTFGGTVTIGCKNKIVGFTITGDLDTGSIPVRYNNSVIYVNQTPRTIEPVLMTTDLVIDNSDGNLGGRFTFSNMVIKIEVTPDKYYTQESLFVESNTAKIVDKSLKTTDFDVTWQGSYSGDFYDTPNSDLNLQITYDSYPVILFPKGDLAGKEYNLECNTDASMGATYMIIYTSVEDTTGTSIEISSEHNNFYTGKIYKIEVYFGLNASVNMTLKTTVSQMGLMSAEDKSNLNNLQTQVGDVSTALDSILTIQNNLLGGNS